MSHSQRRAVTDASNTLGMTASAIVDIAAQEQVERPPNRIWLLQHGPCWCRSHPTDSSSFDYVKLRRTGADLGAWRRNVLIVSERVIDGSGNLYRQVYAEMPDPKVVVAAASCPAAGRFWDDLPNGWAPVEDMIPIDIRVDECMNGNPESLMTAVLAYALAQQEAPQRGVAMSVSLGG
jgi:Ni,Fe-hydrogenase III small subunit